MAGWKKLRVGLLPAVAIAGLGVALVQATRPDPPAVAAPSRPVPIDDEVVARLDRLFVDRWREAAVESAARADDLTLLRRTWLALAGTIPSLEEIRRFEADEQPDRWRRWLDTILADRRTAEHLARRLATALVGTDGGQFIVFRRDRFVAWLADQIHANRPFDEIVTAMVAEQGLWTDTPAVNFITQAADDGAIDAETLAVRVSRALLGQRIDCAQCHDHPFAAWKQPQFEGLAACFAQVKLSPVGVEDDPERVYDAEDRMPADGMPPRRRRVPPRLPYGQEWVPRSDRSRRDLAAWIVHPENRRFPRAIVNRSWRIVFGRAWHEPVDDLPDPAATTDPLDPLDLLAADFQAHGHDLRRLLATLCSSRVYMLASTHPALDEPAGADAVAAAWAAFPLTRLEPDQMIDAMMQATSLRTIDGQSHLVTRTIRFFREIDFVREYGAAADDPQGVPATIPQALVMMNGRLAREMVEANPFTSAGRIAGLARDDDARIELMTLVALTRRPSPEERSALRAVLAQAETPGRGMEDVCWALFNSPEFAWNH